MEERIKVIKKAIADYEISNHILEGLRKGSGSVSANGFNYNFKESDVLIDLLEKFFMGKRLAAAEVIKNGGDPS